LSRAGHITLQNNSGFDHETFYVFTGLDYGMPRLSIIFFSFLVVLEIELRASSARWVAPPLQPHFQHLSDRALPSAFRPE
jgi:hypothetical protein